MRDKHKSEFQQMLEKALSIEPNFIYLGDSGKKTEMSAVTGPSSKAVSLSLQDRSDGKRLI